MIKAFGLPILIRDVFIERCKSHQPILSLQITREIATHTVRVRESERKRERERERVKERVKERGEERDSALIIEQDTH